MMNRQNGKSHRTHEADTPTEGEPMGGLGVIGEDLLDSPEDLALVLGALEWDDLDTADELRKRVESLDEVAI